MSAVKLNALGQVVRFLFIFWNIIVLLIGLGAIGVGSWLIVTNQDYGFVTGNEYASGAALLIAGGIIDVIISVMGIAGAIMLWRVILALYAVIVAVFLVLEIVAGILGFVYRANLDDGVRDRALDAITQDYNNDTSNSATEFVDFIQENFECCGWNNYIDWINSTFWDEQMQFPDTCNCENPMSMVCFSKESANETVSGCKDSVIDALRDNQLVSGAVGIVFGLLQFLAVLFALGLCCCVHRAKGEYTTV